MESALPLLEALGRLCRGPEGNHVRAVLHRYAPMWMLQLHGLLTEPEIEALRRRVQGTSHGRMLRELAEALDILTAEHTLVLVLEDLHWSDPSTLAWLRYIGPRPERARLLIIGTYRSVEAAVQAPTLRIIAQELRGRGQSEALPLQALTADDVRTYVRDRLGQGDVPEELMDYIDRHAGGHPLFLKHIVDHLLDQGLVSFANGSWTVGPDFAALELYIPESLWQLLNAHIERLRPPVQRALEVASVAGHEFAVASVAAGIPCDLEEAEALCHEMMQQSHLLVAEGLEEWHDQTVSGRYRFQHTLYRQVAYERVGPGRAIWLHRRLGDRLERGYGPKVRDVANRLVIHFEAGGEQDRAERYRLQAAQNALRQCAYPEAAQHATQGLTHLDALQEARECTPHAFALHSTLGIALIMLNGFDASEVTHHFAQAWALAPHVWTLPQHFSVLLIMTLVHLYRGEAQRARDISDQLDTWTRWSPNPVLRSLTLRGLGTVSSIQGDFVRARRCLMESLVSFEAAKGARLGLLFGQDHRVAIRVYLAWTLWWLGYPEQALQRGQEALSLTQDSSNPFSIAQARNYLSHLHLFRGETRLATRRRRRP